MTDNKEQSVNKKKENSRKGGQFASGVAVLTVSTVIVKLIGALYKIPMIKYLGEDGMGYFNSAYEIYTFFYILATAGLPVAISIMVAKNAEEGNRANVKRIFSVSIFVLCLLGSIGSAALFFGSDFFGQLIGNSGAVDSVAAIAPMALFVCISGAIRGYFQGHGNMIPTAVSQVIEAAGKLALGLVLSAWAINSGCDVKETAALATLGVTAGAGMSTVYLAFNKSLDKRKKYKSINRQSVQKKKEIVKRLIFIAVPITLSSAVISLTRVVDLLMILRRLQAIGYTEEAANAIYGSYSTLAVSMFNLPASLVTPIALSLVPILASAAGTGDKVRERETLNSSMKLCGLIIIPAALGLSMFSRPILELVFSGETNAIRIAAPLLSVLAASVFFSCLMTVTNAVLQAYGKERKPIISMFCGAAVKIILSYILIGIPEVNIFGAPISTLVCDITVTAINVYHIRKTTDCLNNMFDLFFKTIVSATLAIGACGVGYYGMIYFGIVRETGLLTLAVIGATAIMYILLVMRIGAVSRDELTMIPKGEKIYTIMKKIKLMK